MRTALDTPNEEIHEKRKKSKGLKKNKDKKRFKNDDNFTPLEMMEESKAIDDS